MSLKGTAGLADMPGFIFLKRPTGRALPRQVGRGLPVAGLGAPPHDDVGEYTPEPTRQPPHPGAGPTRGEVARLLSLWLEVVDGRRAPKALTMGRFHPQILQRIPRIQTRAQQSAHARGARGRASRIMTLHLQKGTTTHRRFCASVEIGGRVRAIVGTTAPLSRAEQRQWNKLHKEKAPHGAFAASVALTRAVPSPSPGGQSPGELSPAAVPPLWRIETLTVIWAG